jgi:hypothetical protein
MEAVWLDDNKPNEFYYELSQEEGELICEVLGKLSRDDLTERGFSEKEIDDIHSIYYSF